MNDLKDKSVIVVGGAQGIGKATCERLSELNSKIIIADIDENRGRSLALKLSSITETIYVKTDISDEESVINMVKTAVSNFNRIDVVINCSGFFNFKSIDASVEDWNDILNVNVIGTALLAKHTVPIMRRLGKGSIVNVGSISGFSAQKNYLTYSTTKAAIIHMCRCMALDLAQYNIRVNSVNPGTVWTENNEYFTYKNRGLNKKEANLHPDFGGANMLQRVAEPNEIASAIIFLASDEASFITGESLIVDGGLLSKI